MNGESSTVLRSLARVLRERARGVGRRDFYDSDERAAGRAATADAMEEVADAIEQVITEAGT